MPAPGQTMADIPYVKAYEDNCGVWRMYFRRKGFKGGPLPGPVGSTEFLEAYKAYKEGLPAPLARPTPNASGTFGGLIASYYQTVDFSNLKPSSKRAYRCALEPLKKDHGHRASHDMPREKILKIIEGIGARAPGMANFTQSVLQKMFVSATERGQIKTNPLAQKLTAYKGGTRHTWTDEELAQFESYWAIGTRERLMFALLFFTGQRGGDVVRMSRRDIVNGRIRVKQDKTGVELEIPIHADLAAILKATPAKGLTLIGDEIGRPIQRARLTGVMRKAVATAGLSARCVPHGLRKAVLRVMAENGASARQLASVSGHKTTKELDRYTAAADQPTLATGGIGTIKKRTQVSNLKNTSV
jgi:integrase